MAESLDPRDSLIETIKALQELAARASNKHEAAAAAAQVTRLLMKHNLSIDEVADRNTDAAQMTEAQHAFTRANGSDTFRAPTWKNDLVTAIAKSCLCACFYSPGRSARIYIKCAPAKFTFIGRKSNVDVAVYLFQYLERTIEDLLYQAREKDSSSTGRTYWHSWLMGAVRAISDRLKQELQIFESSGDACRALVKRELDEARAWMYSHHKLGLGSSSSFQLNQSGFAAGNKAGQSVSIRQGVGNQVAGRRLLS